MTRLWLCSAWRVALVAAYLAIAFVDEETAKAAYPAMIVIGLFVVAYDVNERHHRA